MKDVNIKINFSTGITWWLSVIVFLVTIIVIRIELSDKNNVIQQQNQIIIEQQGQLDELREESK